jgi:hypothetical protein
MIGSFRAFDYFDDGSFYLLDVPGVRVSRAAELQIYLMGPFSTKRVTSAVSPV